jgi:hypothetical protein
LIGENVPVPTMPPIDGSLREAAFGATPGADVWLTAEVALGDGDPATELLHDVSGMAHRHRLMPLSWPAGLSWTSWSPARPLRPLRPLVATVGTVRHREQARSALDAVFGRADAPLRAAARRSLWVPSDMLRAGDSAERSSVGEIHGKNVIGTCQESTPRDR